MQMDSRSVNKQRIPQAGLNEMNAAKMNSRSGLRPPGFATSAVKPSTIPSSFYSCSSVCICCVANCISQKRLQPPTLPIDPRLQPLEYPVVPHNVTPERIPSLRLFPHGQHSPEPLRPRRSPKPSDPARERLAQDPRHQWPNGSTAHLLSRDHILH